MNSFGAPTEGVFRRYRLYSPVFGPWDILVQAEPDALVERLREWCDVEKQDCWVATVWSPDLLSGAPIQVN